MIAEQWGFDRTAVDEFALASHEKAAAAQDSGAFDDQIVAIKDQDGNPVLKRRGHPPRDAPWRRWPRSSRVQGGRGDHTRATRRRSPTASAALLFMSAEKAKSSGSSRSPRCTPRRWPASTR